MYPFKILIRLKNVSVTHPRSGSSAGLERSREGPHFAHCDHCPPQGGCGGGGGCIWGGCWGAGRRGVCRGQSETRSRSAGQ